MPVDYSKWDALELSDDSDIEVHPNVDKRSFIRAKQNQIHQERQVRRHRITTLKYERIINDGLISRIDRLMTALKSHKPESGGSIEEVVFQALIESAGDPSEDTPPPPPEGVHTDVQERGMTYSKMMASLVDQVKKVVDESNEEGDRLELFIKEVGTHKTKVEGLQVELEKKLAELEKEEKRHITSDDVKVGFDVSHVKKAQEQAAASKSVSTEPELLNPARPSINPRTSTGQSSGADADIEDGFDPDDVDDESTSASRLGKQFAQIPIGDYRSDLEFISKNPAVLSEKETDGLLIEAFNAQLEGKEKYAQQCVHQALLLQYCRQLGKDGVGLFFKRITTKDHQAQKLFTDDVRTTYQRIKTRGAEINKERAEEAASGEAGGVEQIQLHAVDPNTTINIRVPPAVSDTSSEEEKYNRKIYDSFPPGLQRALESSSLDEVNKVLGKMSVEEAEEIVGQLGEGGMLSLEEGIVDATTEEGQRVVDQIGKTGRMPGQVEEVDEEMEDVEDRMKNLEGMIPKEELYPDPE
ncbi:hypothetical protein K402DRAFT_411353 [Aulographum hederae CBS 113979]|uniref:Hsp90 chaperone protein kinase-targeting subunit n=1 Tax=Aulographum hederae CBS 113979 TaxID=1176131 RepID=A0A6G1H717_9PEZI|nr:hypothetical protein K402DRAFT_411353 [Aulographum hederae CBS 113979]